MTVTETTPAAETKYIGITELRNAIAARMASGKKPAYDTIRSAMRKGLPYLPHPVNPRYTLFREDEALAWWFNPQAR